MSEDLQRKVKGHSAHESNADSVTTSLCDLGLIFIQDKGGPNLAHNIDPREIIDGLAPLSPDLVKRISSPLALLCLF